MKQDNNKTGNVLKKLFKKAVCLRRVTSLMPQPASVWTIPPRHSVKQGVRPVKKEPAKSRVNAFFVFPDGKVKPEHELTAEERQYVCQRVLDAITPLLYDAVLEDIEQEAAG